MSADRQPRAQPDYTLNCEEPAKAVTERSWTLSRTLDNWSHLVFALRTKDGGALAFTASSATDVIEATGAGLVTLNASSNEAALAQQSGGTTANRFTIRRLQMFLTYTPPKDSGQQIRVLAYSDSPIYVQ